MACWQPSVADPAWGGGPLTIGSVGYLVPSDRFASTVHSVYDAACNLTVDDHLLTLCRPGVGQGPTSLVLAHPALPTLRGLFEVGEAVECRDGVMRGERTRLSMLQARVWRPRAPGGWLPDGPRSDNLAFAATRLAQRRAGASNALDREAGVVTAALRAACGRLDVGPAQDFVARLIGWGEGLTPAGDDFLVGLLAGLEATVRADPCRRQFRHALATRIAADAPRTTPVAAHFLRLAAAGHYGEAVCELRNALLAEPRRDLVGAALEAALAVGATSGADTVSGLLAGIGAWFDAPAAVVRH